MWPTSEFAEWRYIGQNVPQNVHFEIRILGFCKTSVRFGERFARIERGVVARGLMITCSTWLGCEFRPLGGPPVLSC